jgi:hypothetical protein
LYGTQTGWRGVYNICAFVLYDILDVVRSLGEELETDPRKDGMEGIMENGVVDVKVRLLFKFYDE